VTQHAKHYGRSFRSNVIWAHRHKQVARNFCLGCKTRRSPLRMRIFAINTKLQQSWRKDPPVHYVRIFVLVKISQATVAVARILGPWTFLASYIQPYIIGIDCSIWITEVVDKHRQTWHTQVRLFHCTAKCKYNNPADYTKTIKQTG